MGDAGDPAETRLAESGEDRRRSRHVARRPRPSRMCSRRPPISAGDARAGAPLVRAAAATGLRLQRVEPLSGRNRAAEARSWRSGRRPLPYTRGRGAIAQLGERLLCKQEVAGSIPAGSTELFGAQTTGAPTR